MQQKGFWFMLSRVLAMLAIVLVVAGGAGASSKFKVLHKFKGQDGANPVAGLIFDATGNLYGTTKYGGSFRRGTVFKLKPNSDGSWTESVLDSPCCWPVAGVIFDGTRNLYGTTSMGGAHSRGQVFKLTPNPDGTWTESVLYSFGDGPSDGSFPSATLIFDAAGNLYGTTAGYYNDGGGTVFKLAPNSDGSWTESVLYTFTGAPFSSGLIFDTAGNLYGTTYFGGDLTCKPYGCGVVFKLKPNSDGSWTKSVLYKFTYGANGRLPLGGLIFDTVGNLYGTAEGGGAYKRGVVFKLTPNSDGSWTESVLHSFAKLASNPVAGLIFDGAGNLYGTAAESGDRSGGAVFKLAPQSDGNWAYSVLHVFLGNPALNPQAGLVLDKAGNLYGTTRDCGRGNNCGVVFEITP